MNKQQNMLSMIKMVLPKLSMFGININEILQTSLKFLPAFFLEKIKPFQDANPDLNVVIMITTRPNEAGEDEVYLVPVGVDGNVITKQDTPLNLNEFLSTLDIEEILKNAGENEPESTDNENELEQN